MDEHIKNIIDLTFEGKPSSLDDEINSALLNKISDIISGKRQEIAKTIIAPESEPDVATESVRFVSAYKCPNCDHTWSGSGNEDSEEDCEECNEKDIKPHYTDVIDDYDRDDHMHEKLEPSMGVEKYIHEFVHSDDSRFEGKSKKERIKMALGAFYSDQKNESVEDQEEIEEGQKSDARRKFTNRIYHINKGLSKLSKARDMSVDSNAKNDKEEVRKGFKQSSDQEVKNALYAMKTVGKSRNSMKEDQEEIDETSPDLKRVYVAKAEKDYEDHVNKANFASFRGDKEALDNHIEKAIRRSKGIVAAKSKKPEVKPGAFHGKFRKERLAYQEDVDDEQE